jgi:hypothetical protein
MKLLQFKLRTLFLLIALISVLSGWVVYQLHWIRERHAFLGRPNWNAMQPPVPPHAAPNLPWSLALFGEAPQDVLAVHETDAENARRLFPESIVVATEP